MSDHLVSANRQHRYISSLWEFGGVSSVMYGWHHMALPPVSV